VLAELAGLGEEAAAAADALRAAAAWPVAAWLAGAWLAGVTPAVHAATDTPTTQVARGSAAG
jgi:hypothetical protein